MNNHTSTVSQTGINPRHNLICINQLNSAFFQKVAHSGRMCADYINPAIINNLHFFFAKSVGSNGKTHQQQKDNEKWYRSDFLHFDIFQAVVPPFPGFRQLANWRQINRTIPHNDYIIALISLSKNHLIPIYRYFLL